MSRYIKESVRLKLYSESCGYCMSPECTNKLVYENDGEVVNLSEIAHIIGLGKNSARSEKELSEYIDKNGYDNLILLCSRCHKIIDTLEQKFGVDAVRAWKRTHVDKRDQLFDSDIRDKTSFCHYVYERLIENRTIFQHNGPTEENVAREDAGRLVVDWRKLCLSKILPNNDSINNAFQLSLRKDIKLGPTLYRTMCLFKSHAAAFKLNITSDQAIERYQKFPHGIIEMIEKELGMESKFSPEDQSIVDLRPSQLEYVVDSRLIKSTQIKSIEKMDDKWIQINTEGKSFKAYVVHTYFITPSTLEQVFSLHPDCEVIIQSNPYGSYTDDAKWMAIHKNVGLFSLNQAQGVFSSGHGYDTNYLLLKDRDERINWLKQSLKSLNDETSLERIEVFGSYLRGYVCDDIDLLITLKRQGSVDSIKQKIESALDNLKTPLDFQFVTAGERNTLKLTADNRVTIWSKNT